MSIRLTGKKVGEKSHCADAYVEAIIELPDPKPKVGDVVLVKAKIFAMNEVFVELNISDSVTTTENIVAVLPSEAKPTDQQ